MSQSTYHSLIADSNCTSNEYFIHSVQLVILEQLFTHCGCRPHSSAGNLTSTSLLALKTAMIAC